MSEYFFTSDTHYFHKNIIDYCRRPFINVDMMNNTLVNNWNAVVRPNDVVIHLGDVAFQVNNKWDEIDKLLRSLNGKIYLVPGNHDVQLLKRPHPFHEVLDQPMYICGMLVSHYPIWDERLVAGDIMLHGHEHNPVNNRLYRMFDVGVDANRFTPISADVIKEKMLARRDYVLGEEKAVKTARDMRERVDVSRDYSCG